MKKITVSAPIPVKKLSEAARNELVEQLFPIHEQVFDGVDKSAFRSYVIEPDSELTKVFLFKNATGDVVGYLTFQVFLVETGLGGNAKRAYVYRTETGMLKAFRGGAPLARILFLECLKFSLKRGFPNAYFMATPVHPVPYCIANRNSGILYPRPNQETPAAISSIMDHMSRTLGLKPATAANNGLKAVGWIVRQGPEDLMRLKSSQDEGIRFYLQRNPGYTQGNGMMMLAPATLQNAFLTGLKMGRRLLKQSFLGLQRQLAEGWRFLRKPSGVSFH